MFPNKACDALESTQPTEVPWSKMVAFLMVITVAPLFVVEKLYQRAAPI